MRCCVLLLCVLITGARFDASAQSSSPPSPPLPRKPGMPAEKPKIDGNTPFKSLGDLGEEQTAERADSGGRLAEIRHQLYRKPSKTELKILAPAPRLLEKYADFLRQPDTGIVKLNADARCVETPEIVVAAENCLAYAMPGAGTAFSFRTKTYRLPRLADLTLVKDVLKTDGVLQQGIMVSLGDVPLESVTLETAGLKYLLEFKTARTGESWLKAKEQIGKGVQTGGFAYGMAFYMRSPTTFALRSIAYKGVFLRAVNGAAYNELDFDRRRDVVVAFRLIEKDAESGDVTLLWKILSNEGAPELKIQRARAAVERKKQ